MAACIIGYGGSQSIDSPQHAVERRPPRACCAISASTSTRFETAFERTSIPSLGLSRGMFFPRESFGRDVLVAGDALIASGNDETRRLANARPLAEFVAGLPIAEAEQGAAACALRRHARSARRQDALRRSAAILKTTSYRDYLIKICGCSDGGRELLPGPHARLLRARLRLGAGRRRARARLSGLPRVSGLPAAAAGRGEPYIYHFPDGNASLARLLVRALIPGIAPGGTMEDVVLAPFDYARLDDGAANVRIRLDSTCVDVRNAGDGVLVGYVRDGAPHRVAARTPCSPAST